MTKYGCPFLGLKEDPNTILEYASDGNHCHHADPVEPVAPEFQKRYCLSDDHVFCPVFQRAGRAPLPAEFSARVDRPLLSLPGRLGVGAGLLVALLALVLLTDLLGLALARFSDGRPGENQGFGGEQTPTPFQPGGGELAASGLQGLLTPTSEEGLADCPLPSGWQVHAASPTDSLLRLSRLHGLSLNFLQKANCMGEQISLQPGQPVYLPFMPTVTPTGLPSPTPTRAVLVQAQPVSAPRQDGDDPSSAPAPPANTPAPPGDPPAPAKDQPEPTSPPQEEENRDDQNREDDGDRDRDDDDDRDHEDDDDRGRDDRDDDRDRDDDDGRDNDDDDEDDDDKDRNDDDEDDDDEHDEDDDRGRGGDD